MLHKVTHCTGRVLADTRPYQLHWGDGETETAISCRNALSTLGACVHVCMRVMHGVNVYVYIVYVLLYVGMWVYPSMCVV